ncbi:hypothetical protein, partial [Xanthomonas vasicola]
MISSGGIPPACQPFIGGSPLSCIARANKKRRFPDSGKTPLVWSQQHLSMDGLINATGKRSNRIRRAE